MAIREPFAGLNDQHFARMRALLEDWRQNLVAPPPTNHDAVLNAISRIYQRLNLKPPVIVYSQSPWQMVTLPLLLRLSVEHDGEIASAHAPGQSDLFLAAIKKARLELDNNPELAKVFRENATDEFGSNSYWVELAPGVAEQIRRRAAADGARLLPGRGMRSSRTTAGRPIAHQLKTQLVRMMASLLRDKYDGLLGAGAHAQLQPLWEAFARMGLVELTLEARLRSQLGQITEDLTDNVDLGLLNNVFAGDGNERRLKRFLSIEIESLFDYILFQEWSTPLLISFLVPLEILERDMCSSEERCEVEDWLTLRRAGICYSFFDRVCFVCQRPSLAMDERQLLHNESGPAMAFPDGYTLYAWHGVVVDRQIVEQPELITPAMIDATGNVETRRVLIERYGPSRYLEDNQANLISEDSYGQLYRKEFPNDEPLVMVRLVNSTAESDGTYRTYFLRVPPEVTTAKEAVAWSFGLSENQYMPSVET